jgi:hypothetical protein
MYIYFIDLFIDLGPLSLLYFLLWWSAFLLGFTRVLSLFGLIRVSLSFWVTSKHYGRPIFRLCPMVCVPFSLALGQKWWQTISLVPNMFPSYSHGVLKGFLKLFPQDVLNTTSDLSHMVCPKFNSHVNKMKKVGHSKVYKFGYGVLNN